MTLSTTPDADGWRSDMENAPEHARVLVAGWQEPSGRVAGYWWMHEDDIIGGMPWSHPKATRWQMFPAPPVSEGG